MEAWREWARARAEARWVGFWPEPDAQLEGRWGWLEHRGLCGGVLGEKEGEKDGAYKTQTTAGFGLSSLFEDGGIIALVEKTRAGGEA